MVCSVLDHYFSLTTVVLIHLLVFGCIWVAWSKFAWKSKEIFYIFCRQIGITTFFEQVMNHLS